MDGVREKTHTPGKQPNMTKYCKKRRNPQFLLISVFINLREFVLNSRHPDPRRVWKVGSGARLLPPLRRDQLDSRDPGENSETSIFDNPSVDFEKKLGKLEPKMLPKLKKSLPVQTKRLLAPKVLFRESAPMHLFCRDVNF